MRPRVTILRTHQNEVAAVRGCIAGQLMVPPAERDVHFNQYAQHAVEHSECNTNVRPISMALKYTRM